MIGLDSNILIRFLTGDDAVQSEAAVRAMSRLTEALPGFISVVVLVETSWTLRRHYRLDYREIGRALAQFATSPVIRLESEQEAFAAIKAAEQDGVQLPDVLIALLGRKAGCVETLTFDEDAARLPGFRLLA